MILDCPQCHARFLVADSLIPASGRTVRCGSCAHQWHVENANGPASNDFRAMLIEEETIIEEFSVGPSFEPSPNSNVPAIARRKWPLKPFKIAVPVLAVIWACLAFVAYFPAGQNGPLAPLYEMFGVTSTNGISFADVKLETEKTDGGRTRYVLSGKIVNHTEDERQVPMAHVSLNDKDGKSIWMRDYPVNVSLKGGEEYPFRISDVETSFAERVKTITLDIGNSFELMVR